MHFGRVPVTNTVLTSGSCAKSSSVTIWLKVALTKDESILMRGHWHFAGAKDNAPTPWRS